VSGFSVDNLWISFCVYWVYHFGMRKAIVLMILFCPFFVSAYEQNYTSVDFPDNSANVTWNRILSEVEANAWGVDPIVITVWESVSTSYHLVCAIDIGNRCDVVDGFAWDGYNATWDSGGLFVNYGWDLIETQSWRTIADQGTLLDPQPTFTVGGDPVLPDCGSPELNTIIYFDDQFYACNGSEWLLLVLDRSMLNVSFGLAVIIMILSLMVIGFLFNNMTSK